MNYKEMQNLTHEFGLTNEGYRLSLKNYTVANIHQNLIDNKTKEIAYSLVFISSFINTLNYDVAKKAAVKRIKVIKEMIVRNKKYELEQDFKNET